MITSGDWDVLLRPAAKCCHEDAIDSDTLVVSVFRRPHFMLKFLRFEISVFPKENRSLNKATVYVARLGALGDPRMARPCEDCWSDLVKLGVKWVVYTTDGGWNRERVN